MRFYDLLNYQHFILYLFPAIIFMIIFGLGLNYSHFRTKNTARRIEHISYEFPDGIKDREEPFPVILILIIAGTLLWGFLYTLLTGLLEVKIG